MTQQEMIDQFVRAYIGDLVVQIAVLRAQVAERDIRIADLQLTQPQPEPPPPEIRPNGSKERRVQDG